MTDEAQRAIAQAVRGADRGLRVIDGGAGGDTPRAEAPADDCPITALGHLDGIFHFLDIGGQKRQLNARQLGSRHDLLSLFGGDEAWLRKTYPRPVMVTDKDDKGNKTTAWVVVVNVNAAAQGLMQRCAAAGLFGDHVVLRRPGVWPAPDGGIAVHCGDAVMVGDAWLPAGAVTGGIYWCASPRTPRPALACPLAVAADLFGRLRDYWNWSVPGGPAAVLGLICTAYYGAAIEWRPAGFLMGDTGSGKSSLLALIRAALPVHYYTNDTTKPGIEQAIDGRAMASIIDEASDRADPEAARRLIDLVLSASGGEGTKGTRGTIDGKGRRIEVSGTIIMSSINPPDLEPQHLGRFALIELRGPAPGVDYRVQHRDAAAFARANAAALWGRALGAFERFQAALVRFRTGLSAAGCGPREMDQAGALIAGWWVLTHEGLPDERGVAEGIGAIDGLIRRASDITTEGRPRRCVDHMMASFVELHRSSEKETVGTLLLRAWGNGYLEGVEAAADHLTRYGIRVIRADAHADRQGRPVPRKADGDGVWLAPANPKLASFFAGTPFDSGRWRYEVARLETCRPSTGNVRVGAVAGRAVWVSRSDLDLPEGEAPEIPP